MGYLLLFCLLFLASCSSSTQYNITSGTSEEKEIPPVLAPKDSAPESSSGSIQPEKLLPIQYPEALDHYRILEIPLSREAKKWESECGAGILVVPSYQLILWHKNDQHPYPIASMTKILSLIVVMDQVQKYKLDWSHPIRISNRVSQIGGSQVWLMAGQQYPIKDLVKAALIKSANDAIEALAEGLAPNQDVRQFVAMMNIRARQIGTRNARFYNVHGLPHQPDNVATARDMVLLTMEFCKYPQLLEWAKILSWEFSHPNGKTIIIRNTNWQLLQQCEGVVGIKTGFTNNAGSCASVLCIRNNIPIIVVVMGFKTSQAGELGKDKRFFFIRSLLDWAYPTLAELNLQSSPSN